MAFHTQCQAFKDKLPDIPKKEDQEKKNRQQKEIHEYPSYYLKRLQNNNDRYEKYMSRLIISPESQNPFFNQSEIQE